MNIKSIVFSYFLISIKTPSMALLLQWFIKCTYFMVAPSLGLRVFFKICIESCESCFDNISINFSILRGRCGGCAEYRLMHNSVKHNFFGKRVFIYLKSMLLVTMHTKPLHRTGTLSVTQKTNNILLIFKYQN